MNDRDFQRRIAGLSAHAASVAARTRALAKATRPRGPRGFVEVGKELDRLIRQARKRRKPPEAGLQVPAVPPRGPKPLSGAAAAPLEFDD